MRKFALRITAIAIIIAAVLSFAGCNYQFIDMTYDFDKAIIKMPDDTVKEVRVSSWTDYDGEQIQIEDTDGNIYVVSSYNCILIKEGN